jgi:NHLM bacteriocin system ABC transporter peptidase/ATP-binding protein
VTFTENILNIPKTVREIYRKRESHRMKKTPTVLQMEAVECGAASLAMVLGYYDCYVPLEALRVACGVTRDGSKASNIIKAARKYGLGAKGYRKELDGLYALPTPMIIHWNFNHFVVLEGFEREKAVINDPAFGRRKVTANELDQAFTGVVIAFKKGPEFRKVGKKPGFLGSAASYLTGARAGMLFVFLAGLVLVFPGILIPVFSRIFIDKILLQNMDNWLLPLLIGIGVTAMLRGALVWIKEHHLLRLENKIALAGSTRLFWHILHLPISFFSQRYAGEIGNRIHLNDSVATLISGRIASAFIDLLAIVLYLVIMLQYDLILTIIGVLIALLNLLFLRFSSSKLRNKNMRLLQDKGKLTGFAMSGLQLIETLKAMGRENEFFSKWAGYHAKLLNSEQEVGEISSRLQTIPGFLMLLNTTVILVIGGFRVLDGSISVGMLVAFQSLMASFMAPVNSIVDLGAQVEQVKGDIARLDDVFKYERDDKISDVSSQDVTESFTKLEGSLEIYGLTYGYSKMDLPLMEDFQLSLSPGARVALVGGSGSGKSTLAKIIAGIYEPWSGEIRLDGKPVVEIPRIILNQSLAMVDQDILLFEGSIRDNITLWDSTLTDAAVIRAAKDACIHDEIASRPGGYKHRLEENGRNISGGQRQRIEIARALVRSPRILIMDEATSALDPNTEKRVDENIRKRGVTTIVVAHRLSTIRDCDEIIVLEAGQVVERGTHDELVAIDGRYKKLIRMQVKER